MTRECQSGIHVLQISGMAGPIQPQFSGNEESCEQSGHKNQILSIQLSVEGVMWLLGVVGLLCWQPGCTKQAVFCEPSKTRSLECRISSSKLANDVNVLFETIRQCHPNMCAYVSEEEVAAIRQRTYEAVGQPMTKQEFYWVVAFAVASLKNAHTFIVPLDEEFEAYLNGGGKYFPLNLRYDRGRIILSTVQVQDLPTGAELLFINGEHATSVFDRFARTRAAERHNSNYQATVQAAPLYLWMAGYDASRPLELEVQTFDGKSLRYELDSAARTDIVAAKRKNQELLGRKNYSFRLLPEHNVGLIELNLLIEDRAERFDAFLRETFKKLSDQHVSHLIIDLRRNPGGNSSLGDMLISYLTDAPIRQAELEMVRMSPLLRASAGADIESIEKEYLGGQEAKDGEVYTYCPLEVKPSSVSCPFRGHVYLLIGSGNYSSAVLLASAMKHYRLATIVGEETGDPTAQYGNILWFSLPNSGLKVGVAAKYFVMAGGTEDGHGVTPDHEIVQTSTDSACGKDAVMKYVLNLINPD